MRVRHLPHRPSARGAAGLLLLLLLAGCRGYDAIPGEEAAWRQAQSGLIGMTPDHVAQCAGPPGRVEPAEAGGVNWLYRAADLGNYCEAALTIRHGRVAAVSARSSAPEFLFLRDGTNYCGRIFAACTGPSPPSRSDLTPAG